MQTHTPLLYTTDGPFERARGLSPTPSPLPVDAIHPRARAFDTLPAPADMVIIAGDLNSATFMLHRGTRRRPGADESRSCPCPRARTVRHRPVTLRSRALHRCRTAAAPMPDLRPAARSLLRPPASIRSPAAWATPSASFARSPRGAPPDPLAVPCTPPGPSATLSSSLIARSSSIMMLSGTHRSSPRTVRRLSTPRLPPLPAACGFSGSSRLSRSAAFAAFPLRLFRRSAWRRPPPYRTRPPPPRPPPRRGCTRQILRIRPGRTPSPRRPRRARSSWFATLSSSIRSCVISTSVPPAGGLLAVALVRLGVRGQRLFQPLGRRDVQVVVGSSSTSRLCPSLTSPASTLRPRSAARQQAERLILIGPAEQERAGQIAGALLVPTIAPQVLDRPCRGGSGVRDAGGSGRCRPASRCGASRVRLLLAEHAVDQRGLARPVGSDHADPIAPLDRQAQLPEQLRCRRSPCSGRPAANTTSPGRVFGLNRIAAVPVSTGRSSNSSRIEPLQPLLAARRLPARWPAR